MALSRELTVDDTFGKHSFLAITRAARTALPLIAACDLTDAGKLKVRDATSRPGKGWRAATSPEVRAVVAQLELVLANAE